MTAHQLLITMDHFGKAGFARRQLRVLLKNVTAN